jgi:hypothetical protein
MEAAEADFGNLHYKIKVHTILCSPWALATLPVVLDIVEQFIGFNILLYNVTYIVKEPGSEAHVSWHQDLTYWGFSHDDQGVWRYRLPPKQAAVCVWCLEAIDRADCITTGPRTRPMCFFRARQYPV